MGKKRGKTVESRSGKSRSSAASQYISINENEMQSTELVSEPAHLQSECNGRACCHQSDHPQPSDSRTRRIEMLRATLYRLGRFFEEYK